MLRRRPKPRIEPTALKYVARNIARTEKIVAGFPAVFVDSSELDPDFRLPGGVHPLARAADSVIDAGVRPIAVTGLHRDDEHRAEALSIAKAQDLPGLCVRLDATDVSTATLTHKRLRDLVGAAALEPTDVYVLLDLQCLFEHDKEAVSKQVLRFLKLLESRHLGGHIGRADTGFRTNCHRRAPRTIKRICAESSRMCLTTLRQLR